MHNQDDTTFISLLTNNTDIQQLLLQYNQSYNYLCYHYSKLRLPKLRFFNINISNNNLCWFDLTNTQQHISYINLRDIKYIQLAKPIANNLQQLTVHNYNVYNCISILTCNGVLELECLNSDDIYFMYNVLKLYLHCKHNNTVLLTNINNNDNNINNNHNNNLFDTLINAMYKQHDQSIVNNTIQHIVHHNINKLTVSYFTELQYIKCYYNGINERIIYLQYMFNDKQNIEKLNNTYKDILNNKLYTIQYNNNILYNIINEYKLLNKLVVQSSDL